MLLVHQHGEDRLQQEVISPHMIASPNSSGLRLRHRSSFTQPQHLRSPSGFAFDDEGQPLLAEHQQDPPSPIAEQPALESKGQEQQQQQQQSTTQDEVPATVHPLHAEASSSASHSSVADYAARLHPTLLQHYYDVRSMSSLNKDDGGSANLPALAFQEVVLGDIIGRGGFSFVHEIRNVRLQEIYDTGEAESASRKAFAATFQQSEDGAAPNGKPPSQQYVLKTLRPDLPEDEHNKGIIDLAVEAQFLAALDHPHILSLRGHANSDPLESRYFVVLDRLVSTLDHKLKVWRKDVGISMGYWLGPCIGYCCGKTHVLHRIWLERFQVARDIASALDYLHKQDIVYRDLKPDNVGFNSEGELKMFDFGLAKRVTNADKTDDEQYNLTGNTGSLRYMAPEVAKNMPYSLSVDAYSFGVLFWQLCSLSVPYSGYSCKMHADMVVGKGYRPSPDPSWPETWSLLMSQCWSADHRTRPSFERILKVMNEELEFWTAEGEDFMSEGEEGGKDVEKIKARRSKSVFKIRARRDRHTLDIDTRLANPEGPTAKKHDANIV